MASSITWSFVTAALAGSVQGCSNNPPPAAPDDAGAFEAAVPIGDGGIAECFETLGESTDCVTCLSASCSPLWSGAQTLCAAYLACVCPRGIATRRQRHTTWLICGLVPML